MNSISDSCYDDCNSRNLDTCSNSNSNMIDRSKDRANNPDQILPQQIIIQNYYLPSEYATGYQIIMHPAENQQEIQCFKDRAQEFRISQTITYRINNKKMFVVEEPLVNNDNELKFQYNCEKCKIEFQKFSQLKFHLTVIFFFLN